MSLLFIIVYAREMFESVVRLTRLLTLLFFERQPSKIEARLSSALTVGMQEVIERAACTTVLHHTRR